MTPASVISPLFSDESCQFGPYRYLRCVIAMFIRGDTVNGQTGFVYILEGF